MASHNNDHLLSQMTACVYIVSTSTLQNHISPVSIWTPSSTSDFYQPIQMACKNSISWLAFWSSYIIGNLASPSNWGFCNVVKDYAWHKTVWLSLLMFQGLPFDPLSQTTSSSLCFLTWQAIFQLNIINIKCEMYNFTQQMCKYNDCFHTGFPLTPPSAIGQTNI